MTVVSNNNYMNIDLRPLNQLPNNGIQSEEPADGLSLVGTYISSGLAGSVGTLKSIKMDTKIKFEEISAAAEHLRPENIRRIDGMISFNPNNSTIIDNYNNLAKGSPEVIKHFESIAGRSPNLQSDMNFSEHHGYELKNAHENTIKNYQALEKRYPNDPNIKIIKEYEILKYKEVPGSGRSEGRIEGVSFNQQREKINFGEMAKSVGNSALQGAKFGAIFGGAVSGIINGYQVLTGIKTGNEAAGTFLADTAASTFSGAVGSALGGLTYFGLSGIMGMASLPLTVLTAGAGLVGAIGANFLFQKTGIYDMIKNLIK